MKTQKEERRIIVFGTGKETEIFLYRNSLSEINHYEVDFYIDSNPRRDTFRGKSVFSLKGDIVRRILSSKEYIIITTPLHEYIEIADRLLEIGLREYEDFIYYEALGKKTAIFYGNCHMERLAHYMKNIPVFADEYWIYPFKVISAKEKLRAIGQEVFDNCSLFISQIISERVAGYEYSTENIIGKLHKECNTILIPNLYRKGFGFFPQSEYKPLDLARETEQQFVKYVDCQDKIIKDLYRQGNSVEQIADRIINGNVFSNEEITNSFDKYMDMIYREDQKCDVKIYEYIKENYRHKMIFTDPGHMSEIVFRQYIIQILDIIGLRGIAESVDKLFDNKDSLLMPIYGCVAKVLGLKWYNHEDVLKDGTFTLTGNALSVIEYVREYIFISVDCNLE